MLVGLGIDDDQDAPEGIDSGQDETLLGMVVRIDHRAGQIIVEDLNGIGEVDMMLTPVDLVFALVPFEFDTINCIDNSCAERLQWD